jgi:pimeloyl-ACP methyl ester carboxylesterase
MNSQRQNKSTTVRSPIWALRRVAIRSMAPIAPARAAHLAARWFVTPDRLMGSDFSSAPALRLDWLSGDRTGDAAHGDAGTPILLRGRHGELAAWSWGEGPLVLLVHGWNGRGLQLKAMAQAVAARGYRAVAFDHPAHGQSSGRTATIPDMADAIQDAADQLGGARSLIAHSLGAVAATVAMARGLAVERAVFVAPPVRPDQWLIRFGRAVGLPASAEPSLVAAIEARAGVPVSAVRPLELAGSLSVPLLVVHDREDRRVPYAEGQALARVWPGARLLTTQGLGHTRLLSSPTAIEAAVDFIGAAPPEPRRGMRDRHMEAFVAELDPRAAD